MAIFDKQWASELRMYADRLLDIDKYLADRSTETYQQVRPRLQEASFELNAAARALENIE